MMTDLLHNPMALAMLVVFGLVALIVMYKLVTNLSAQRAQLLREERERLDAAAKAQAGDPTLNAIANVFDPLGLFH